MLEPKPNVRLHRNTPDVVLDKVVDMVSHSQGAPFLINFDERAMAGMMREAKEGHVEKLINEDNVFEYASVGCMENTMVGNDRSETVNCNVVLVKAVELALGDGKDLVDHYDFAGKPYPIRQDGPKTGDPRDFKDFEQFYRAFEEQIKFVIKKSVDLYNLGDLMRARYSPTPVSYTHLQRLYSGRVMRYGDNGCPDEYACAFRSWHLCRNGDQRYIDHCGSIHLWAC